MNELDRSTDTNANLTRGEDAEDRLARIENMLVQLLQQKNSGEDLISLFPCNSVSFILLFLLL